MTLCLPEAPEEEQEGASTLLAPSAETRLSGSLPCPAHREEGLVTPHPV
jgi:hypothetical protein